jgi:mRNA interferase MazF
MAAAAERMKAMRRERIGQRIGRLGTEELTQLSVALALVMGLAD